MLAHFNKKDRRLLTLAVFLLLVFSYLLIDDSLLMDLIGGHGKKVAQVIKSENDVRQKYASDFRWISVQTTPIYENDSLFTGNQSEAIVVLEDKTEIHLKENSLVTFRTVNGQLTLGLVYGQAPEIKGNVNSIQLEKATTDARKPSSSIVSIPTITSPEPYSKRLIPLNLSGEREQNGVMTIEWKYEKNSTQFEIQLSQTPDFSTLEHSFKSTEKMAITPDLKEGTYFTRVREVIDEKSYGKWSKPIQFDITHQIPESLPTPELITKELNLKYEDKNVPTIEWKASEGATDYIIEVSTNDKFERPFQYKSGQTKFTLKEKQPGFYQFRVTAHNQLGIQSRPSETGVMNIRTNAPILSQVPPKKYIAKNKKDRPAPTRFNLKWSEVPNSESYLIEISPDENFQNPKRYQARSPASIAEIPTTGKYHWRVRSLSSTGQPISDFSQASNILYTFESPLQPPTLKEPLDQMTLFFQKKRGNPFYLEWAKAPHASHYSFEIAKDPDFKNIVLKKQVSSARYLLNETLPPGELYWRVRSEAPERISEWSQPRKMNVFGGRTARGQ